MPILYWLQSHTILLVQPSSKPEGRTYSDYETVNEMLEGVYSKMRLVFQFRFVYVLTVPTCISTYQSICLFSIYSSLKFIFQNLWFCFLTQSIFYTVISFQLKHHLDLCWIYFKLYFKLTFSWRSVIGSVSWKQLLALR